MKIGPPAVPPNWFRFRTPRADPGIDCPVTGSTRSRSKKLRASSFSLRRNSKTEPCKLLVPDLVTTFTTAPENRPYSGSKEFVINRNSWMESMTGMMEVPLLRLSSTSPPFTRKELDDSRWPFTETLPAKSVPDTGRSEYLINPVLNWLGTTPACRPMRSV